ncbi:DNA primase [Pseudomonas phage WP1]
MVSKYFWLSLYCRINYPGISAPIYSGFDWWARCG